MVAGERLLTPLLPEGMGIALLNRALTAIILILAVPLLGGAYYAAFLHKPKEEVPDNSNGLNVGGSSVVFFIMDKWKNAYNKEKGVDIIYTSSGSSSGVKETIAKTYQIGFTSAAMTDEQRKQAQAKGGDVIHVPVTLIAVAPIYNVKELNNKPPLKFTGEVLADIFLGNIKKWNDSAIQKLNDKVELPDAKIVVIHRKDASGTTFLFTEYLAGASEAWKKAMGPASSEVKWPEDGENMKGILRNYGVAGEVKRTEGAIGYVELMHALNNKIKCGAVQNHDKTHFIDATPENVTAAAKTLGDELPENASITLTNRPGKDAYPICGIEWAVCYQTQPAGQQKRIVDFLLWATHDGQQFAKDMHYAPLPEGLVQRAEQKIKSIKSAL